MRLFVALDIPDCVRSSLAALSTKLRDACQDARWPRIEGLHVTLKFIGETPAEKTEIIKAALAAVPVRAPITINFRDLGFFPNARRPRVLWAGIESSPELAELAAAVDTALHPLGIPREERAFTPHLTLARFSTPRGLDSLHAAIEKAGPVDFGSITAKEFHLYQSVLKPGGAEYTRLATFSFAAAPAEPSARRRPE
jgi:RNA 2',3'-cyclic 3'-phosphodiesterase